MDFFRKYELLDLALDDGIKTFTARDILHDKPVAVHVFAVKEPANLDLLQRLRSLKLGDDLIEMGEHAGTPYVVTGPLQSHRSLREWTAAHVSPPLSGPHATPAPPEAGEFTRLFREAPPEPSRPGEFTALFNRPGASGQLSASVPIAALDIGVSGRRDPAGEPTPSGSSLPMRKEARGEFTRVFGQDNPLDPEPAPALSLAPVLPSPALPPASTAPSHGPGEYTKVFRAGPTAESVRSPVDPVPTTPAAPPQSSGGTPSYLPLFLILAGLLLVALMVIVVFAWPK